MKRSARPVLSCLVLTLVHTYSLASQSEYSDSILRGISNEGRTRDQPYVTAGDRAYLIGSQEGGFPEMGQHDPGEMGGLWLQPIKLADGFWASVREEASDREIPLAEAEDLVTYPHGTRFRYGSVLEGLEIERFQFSPDGEPGIIIQYQIQEHDRSSQATWRCCSRPGPS